MKGITIKKSDPVCTVKPLVISRDHLKRVLDNGVKRARRDDLTRRLTSYRYPPAS